jgi:hypothetical protein
VIWESGPWKKELWQRAHSLGKRQSQKRWTQASSVGVEKDVFFSAYAIRRLLEAEKISDEVEALGIHVTTYRALNKSIDHMNWDSINELYNLENPSNGHTLSLRDFCNQIIHSFAFLPCFKEEGGICGFFFSSERSKNQVLYYLELGRYVSLLLTIATDDIVHIEMVRDFIGGPRRTIKKSSRPSGQNRPALSGDRE